jgi:hypothetical protein
MVRALATLVTPPVDEPEPSVQWSNEDYGQRLPDSEQV